MNAVVARPVTAKKPHITTAPTPILPNAAVCALTPTNNDFHALVTLENTPDIAKDTDSCRHTWTLLTAASSNAEAIYKERLVQQILQGTNGRQVMLSREHEELVAHFLITSIYIPRVLRPSSAMSTSFGVMESFSRLPKD